MGKDQRPRNSISVACIQLDKEAGLADFCRSGHCRGSGLEAANIQEKAIVGVSVDTVYMYICTPGAEGWALLFSRVLRLVMPFM